MSADDKKSADSEDQTNLDPEGVDSDAPASLDDDGDSGKSRKKVLMIVIPLVLITLVGAGLYFSGILTGSDTEIAEDADKAAVEEAKELSKQAAEDNKAIVFLPLPDMIVNLSTSSNQPRYLRLSVQLELGSEADKAAVEAVLPRVVDKFQTYLRELRVEDLRGSKGYHRLQIELLSRVNAAAYPTKVRSVLFQEMLIQ